MKKRRLSSNYSTLWRFCQGFARALGALLVILGLNFGILTINLGVAAAEENTLTPEAKATIKDNCVKIKDILSDVQHRDSRARVYLGRQYETLLTKFITPLNLRLVENNISNPKLLENQTAFAGLRTLFVNDYIKYQQSLEELVSLDCRAEPERFYNRLVYVREKRAAVEKDVDRLRALAKTQKTLTEELRASFEKEAYD